MGSSPISATRPVGQAVKTRPFHGCNMGSIPVRVTKSKEEAQRASFFDFVIRLESSPANSAGICQGAVCRNQGFRQTSRNDRVRFRSTKATHLDGFLCFMILYRIESRKFQRESSPAEARDAAERCINGDFLPTIKCRAGGNGAFAFPYPCDWFLARAAGQFHFPRDGALLHNGRD